jgi:hypothetical protein
MRFDDPIFIVVAESKQSGLVDRRSQQLIEVRIGHAMVLSRPVLHV